jgi:ABC-type lipoprotein release transport system permease subunit
MIIKLAWRNIWRNRRRSIIVLVAIAIGIFSLALTDSFYNGLLLQMFRDQVGTHVAHLQIHRNGFNENKVVQNWLPDPGKVERVLAADSVVAHFSRRVIAFGIVSSASNSSGITLVGVDPDRERLVTTIGQSVASGTYLQEGQRAILISRRMAEKLSVRIGDKLVVMATALDGSVGTDVFRICGVYETSSSEFDRLFVYIPLEYSQQMLGLGDRVMEIAAVLRTPDDAYALRDRLRPALGSDFEVLTFADLIPMMMQIISVTRQSLVIYYVIIGIATVFGIVNALLMSVFERTRELGILMATGMKSRSILAMILLEALLLSLIGTVIGLGIGLALSLRLAHTGIDLSSFTEGLTMMGASSTIYPIVSLEGIVNGLTIIPVIALIAALYPAAKAIRLDPVRAIHYV